MSEHDSDDLFDIDDESNNLVCEENALLPLSTGSHNCNDFGISASDDSTFKIEDTLKELHYSSDDLSLLTETQYTQK